MKRVNVMNCKHNKQFRTITMEYAASIQAPAFIPVYNPNTGNTVYFVQDTYIENEIGDEGEFIYRPAKKYEKQFPKLRGYQFIIHYKL